MLEEIVAPDVDDEGDRRPYELDVREILIRADADVHASVRADLPQLARDLEVGLLVGDDVVGIEVPSRLGQTRDERRERRRVGRRGAGTLGAKRRCRDAERGGAGEAGDAGEAGSEDAPTATSRRA
jgi:hypothetical protein